MRQAISNYIGVKKETGFNGYIAEDNVYITFESEADLLPEVGNRFLQECVQFLKSNQIESLAIFDEGLTHIMTQVDVPSGISFAAIYVKEPILYIKTMGEGAVHLARGQKHAQLVSGDAIASGQAKPKDLFILAPHTFIQQLNLDTVLALKDFDFTELPHSISVPGVVAIFIHFDDEVLPPVVTLPSYDTPPVQSPQWLLGLKENIRRPYETLRTRTEAAGRKKLSTLVVIFILTIILVWSVGLASKRRGEEIHQKNIKSASEIIGAKLAQADEVAFLNLPSAMTLIKEAKVELGTLKESLGKDTRYGSQIRQLEASITEKENTITRKEEKTSEEFFDLAVDTKGASGALLYRENENLGIVDTRQGVFYMVSLLQKSLDKRSATQLKTAKLIAVSSDTQLVFIPESGVFGVEESALKQLIAKDADWGTITAMSVYNGNVYLLDGGKSSIYKYVPVEDGYSEKQVYLADGENPAIGGARSMAIDSSVYVTTSDGIVKFTSGLRDGFATDFPDRSPSITKVITHNDLSNVYVWDKSKGTLYVLAKNGTFEKEVQSSVLKQAADVTVYSDAAYALIGPKLYKILL